MKKILNNFFKHKNAFTLVLFKIIHKIDYLHLNCNILGSAILTLKKKQKIEIVII